MAIQKHKLAGRQFGRLTVMTYSGGSKWLCVCSCGAKKTVAATDLVNGKTSSCGCLQKELLGSSRRLLIQLDSVIQTAYGDLIVLGEKPKVGQFRRFELKCFCGNIFETRLNSLRTGNTKSCGCLMRQVNAENHRTHGMTGTLVYARWQAMITRATNPNTKSAHCYTGRGITVCDRWRVFENFLEDMGEISDPTLTLDRIDNDGDYCKENCRWASMKEQSRNKRRGDHVSGIRQLPSGNYRVLINTDTQINKHVGVYPTYEEAKEARLKAEQTYWRITDEKTNSEDGAGCSGENN